MKRASLFCLAGFGLIMAAGCGNKSTSPVPAARDLTGTWIWTVSAFPDEPLTVHIVQSGNSITGQTDAQNGGVRSLTGTVSGDALSGTGVMFSSECTGTRQFPIVLDINGAGTALTSRSSIQAYDCNGQDWVSANFGTLTATKQ